MDNNMIFTRKTLVDATHVDRWGRMRPASLLEVMQETAGDHAALLGVGREQLDPRGCSGPSSARPLRFTACRESGRQCWRRPGRAQPDGRIPGIWWAGRPRGRSCSGRWRCGC